MVHHPLKLSGAMPIYIRAWLSGPQGVGSVVANWLAIQMKMPCAQQESERLAAPYVAEYARQDVTPSFCETVIRANTCIEGSNPSLSTQSATQRNLASLPRKSREIAVILQMLRLNWTRESLALA